MGSFRAVSAGCLTPNGHLFCNPDLNLSGGFKQGANALCVLTKINYGGAQQNSQLKRLESSLSPPFERRQDTPRSVYRKGGQQQRINVS